MKGSQTIEIKPEVLHRLAYALSFILKRRYPSMEMYFHRTMDNELLIRVEVLDIEDCGDRCVNPEPGLDDALTGFLESIGIRKNSPLGFVYVAHKHSGMQFTRQVMNQDRGLSHRSHERYLKMINGGVEDILEYLDKILPHIPAGQVVPHVLLNSDTCV